MLGTKIELPVNEFSEKLLLARMMNSINDLNTVFEKTNVDDFYFELNKDLYLSMYNLFKSDSPVDYPSLWNIYDKKSDRDRYLTLIYNLDKEGQTAIDIDYYIEQILDCSRKRKLIHITKDVMEQCEGKKGSEEIYNSLQENCDLIFNSLNNKNYFSVKEILLGKSHDDGISILQWVENQQEKYRKGISTMNGIPTTYHRLDKVLDGINKGHFVIIGARPGVGKTTFALNIAHRMMSFHNIKVGFFSLEMAGDELTKKILCLASDIGFDRLRGGMINGIEFQRFYEAHQLYLKDNFFVDDQSGLRISQLCARAKRMKTCQNIEVLFVDYLSIIQGDKMKYSTKQEEIQEVSSRLRNLAKDLKIPIICLAQLNRESERENRKPRKSDLRESGQIEQDAHSILILDKPSEDDTTNQPGLLKAYIVKNRFGQETVIDFSFNGATGLINEYNPLAEDIKEINEQGEYNL